MEEQRAFKFRIIAQDRTYLCMGWGFEKDDCIAKEVIREWDSGNATPIMPWVRFSGDYIIEPIVAQATSKPDTFARDLEALAA